jgi:hypothetical protein
MNAATNGNSIWVIQDSHEGAVRTKTVSQDVTYWLGHIFYPDLHKAQMELPLGSQRLAIQLFVDGSSYEFALNVRGIAVILERFHSAGC